MLNLYFILLEVSTAPKFPARPANCFVRPNPARPGINILQNLYNGLTIFCGEGGQKLMKILLSMSIICDLLSVHMQTCGILKTQIFKKILNLDKTLKTRDKLCTL